MPQETSYPDPEQLRAYADEPMPFTEVADLDMNYQGHLVGGSEGVEYDFRPSYIRVQPEDDDHYYVRPRDQVEFDHARAWSIALDVEVAEDYVCAHGHAEKMLPRGGMYEAFWILDTVTIARPRD